jgi:hypothetical protein
MSSADHDRGAAAVDGLHLLATMSRRLRLSDW